MYVARERFRISAHLTFVTAAYNAALCCQFVEYLSPREAVCIVLYDSPLKPLANIPERAVDYAVKIRVNPQQMGIDLNVKHSMVRKET
jgi:hypothetical protein